MVSVAESADLEVFELILDTLKSVVARERAKASAAPPPIMDMIGSPDAVSSQGYTASQSLSNVVTRGYVQIFTRLMNKDATRAVKAFQATVHIARSGSCETDARLTAMKMLFRLRADFENRIYLTPTVDVGTLAESLYRTEASLARKLAEDAAQPARLSRSTDPAGSSARPVRGISFTQGQPGDKSAPPRSSNVPRGPTQKTQRLCEHSGPGCLTRTAAGQTQSSSSLAVQGGRRFRRAIGRRLSHAQHELLAGCAA